MKKLLCLIAIVSILVMIFPLVTPAIKAAQPPIDTTTLYLGDAGWGPVDSDPAIAYDTASGELLFNTEEGLLGFAGEQYYNFVPLLATNIPTRADITLTITSTSAVLADPTGSTWSGGLTCLGWVDELADGFNAGDPIFLGQIGVPGTYHTWTVDTMTGSSPTITLTLWRGSYVFNLRPANTIPFYDHTGAVVDHFNVTDAEYSFEHALVMDVPGQPIWMMDKPLFDLPDHTYFDNSTAINLAHLIDDAIVGDAVANTLTINVGVRFPDNAFKQIISNTWGDIVSKEYVVANALGWDGNLYTATKYGSTPNWWIDWAGQGAGIDYATQDPLDAMTPSCFVGTGPYHIDTISQVSGQVIYKRNPTYWRNWPAAGSSGFVDTVVDEFIATWTSRKTAFLAGDVDTCYVPRASMFELIDNSTGNPIGGVSAPIETIKNIVPPLSLDAPEFQFDIAAASTYIGTGSFPGGIPLNFFNNTHTRKAFCYSFNWSTYTSQAYFGEADYRSNALAAGLYPDYYVVNISQQYYESKVNAEAELKAALFGGVSVWTSGFTLTLTYNTGNDLRKIGCQMIRDFFLALSTYDGRVAPPFNINILEITWTDTIHGMTRRLLPIYAIGWLADFADADDFVRPYMSSGGAFAWYSNYTAANGWGSTKDVLIDQAVLTPDGPARQAIYNQLAVIYYNDAPSMPWVNPRGRAWRNYWVKGWYYDAVYPGAYFYTMWKADDCWFDVSGTPPGVSDGSTNMKDIAYLILHFNAKAPIPGVPVDPKWVGVYGANGCVDPYGDRVSNMKDIAAAIQHFNHKANTGTP
jgi:peptide/nickel transport system substrate-binding protein